MGILRYCSHLKTPFSQRFTPILDGTWIAYLQDVSIVSYRVLPFLLMMHITFFQDTYLIYVQLLFSF